MAVETEKSRSAAIRFGPALKALLLCMLIAGSAIGYVWQKNEIYRLGRQISQRESTLETNDGRQRTIEADQLAVLRSPVKLDQRVRELKLGLAPAQPSQIWRLPEPAAPPAHNPASRQWAERQAGAPLTP